MPKDKVIKPAWMTDAALGAVLKASTSYVLTIAGTWIYASVPSRALVAKDKKRDSTGLRMVLLEAVGRPVLSTVDDATLDVALAAVGL